MSEESKLGNKELRDVLKYLSRSSTVLDAFFLDHFPFIFKRFSNMMDTEQKLNIALEGIARQEFLSAISRNFGQEELNNAIQISLDNSRRLANPSLANRLQWQILRNKWAILSLSILLGIAIFGDPASWRQQIVPRIKAFFVTDPTVILEEAWADFDQKDFKSSLEKARCVMFMHSSSREQKRQASLLLSYITEAKAKEMVDHDLRNTLADNISTKSSKRVHELANRRHLSLPSPSQDPLKGAHQGNPLDGSAIDSTDPQNLEVDAERVKKEINDVKQQALRAENQLAKASSEREQFRWQVRTIAAMMGSMKTEIDHTLMAVADTERRLEMASFSNTQLNGQSSSMQSIVWQMKTGLQGIKTRLEKASQDHNQLMFQTNIIQA